MILSHARVIDTSIVDIMFVAFIGISLLFVTGFASADTIHDTTHDVRHSVGFPCH